jgi:hypothetical protein
LKVNATSIAAILTVLAYDCTVAAIRGIAGYVNAFAVARHFIGRCACAGSLDTHLRFDTGVIASAAVRFVLGYVRADISAKLVRFLGTSAFTILAQG